MPRTRIIVQKRSNPVGDAVSNVASAVILVPVLIIEGVFGLLNG